MCVCVCVCVRADVNALLSESLMATCGDGSVLVPAVLMASAALLASLHALLGHEIGVCVCVCVCVLGGSGSGIGVHKIIEQGK